MRIVNDYSISIMIFITMFVSFVITDLNNRQIIEQQHNTIYQQESKIDDLKYQIGQCRLMVGQNYSEYE